MIIFFSSRSDKFDEGDNEADAEEDENGGEEVNPKKEAKKPTAAASKNAKSKLDVAVANERNNSSILSFFGKSVQQKRPANACSSDIVSHFLTNRKLKACKVF